MKIEAIEAELRQAHTALRDAKELAQERALDLSRARRALAEAEMKLRQAGKVEGKNEGERLASITAQLPDEVAAVSDATESHSLAADAVNLAELDWQLARYIVDLHARYRE